MDQKKFAKIAESLRQYRRAELKDFETEIGDKPIDALYVDPLPSEAVLSTVLSSNTTFLLGRKGTGKSTVFAKAQSVIRKERKDISIYIDVKAIYDLMGNAETPMSLISNESIDDDILQAHLLRKYFLASVISDLLKEIREACKHLSLLDKWAGKKRSMLELLTKLELIEKDIKIGRLTASEIPILQLISKKTREQNQRKERAEESIALGTKFSTSSVAINNEFKLINYDEMFQDNEVYDSYSDAILRSFPFAEIMEQIKDLLNEVGMNRLIIFFDDFSEISFLNQKLFVDVVLAPLNNSSDEKVKLKVAGYPGRVYFGKIDPGKIDIMYLDFANLYKSKDIQTTENRATEYTTRLLSQRFKAFGVELYDYFDPNTSLQDYMRLIFECTFNVPRLMGYILHYCYKDRISHGLPITTSVIKLSTQKYYEDVLIKYFDRMNRYALEPFERKLDRHIQYELLCAIIDEAKNVRRGIITKEIGGSYFNGLSNPPVSHFSINTEFEGLLSSLELNFLVTRYHDMRDKDGKDVSIYCFFYGLCEAERLPWGYPRGRRDDRSYFVQRCFSYNRILHEFLAKRQTIRCNECGASFSIDKKEAIALYNWQCPECKIGKCSVVNLSDDFKKEIDKLNKDLMIEEIELNILEVLNDEDRTMRASEISALVDTTYQLVGKRTGKLQEVGYVEKKVADSGFVYNKITDLSRELFFEN